MNDKSESAYSPENNEGLLFIWARRELIEVIFLSDGYAFCGVPHPLKKNGEINELHGGAIAVYVEAIGYAQAIIKAREVAAKAGYAIPEKADA